MIEITNRLIFFYTSELYETLRLQNLLFKRHIYIAKLLASSEKERECKLTGSSAI